VPKQNRQAPSWVTSRRSFGLILRTRGCAEGVTCSARELVRRSGTNAGVDSEDRGMGRMFRALGRIQIERKAGRIGGRAGAVEVGSAGGFGRDSDGRPA